MGISIIIVNYNLTIELVNCLSSIFKYLVNKSFEVIVIDNNSADKGVRKVENLFPDVRIHLLSENLGFSKANNYGVDRAIHEHILFLNPDTLLTEDFISPIIDFLRQNDQAGACGPMLCYSDMSYQNSSGKRLGVIYESAEAFMFINYYRTILKWLNRKRLVSGKPFRVNWLSGACMILRKDLFLSIGGFSADFFLNYEDIDLCKRIEDSGYYNYYFPYLKCIHLDQTSQKKNFEHFVYSRYASRLIYARNHYGFIKRFVIKIIHIIGLFARLITADFFYDNHERVQRSSGYKRALALYLGNRYGK